MVSEGDPEVQETGCLYSGPGAFGLVSWSYSPQVQNPSVLPDDVTCKGVFRACKLPVVPCACETCWASTEEQGTSRVQNQVSWLDPSAQLPLNAG